MSKCADPAGGAELYMLFLVEELRRRGHDVLLFGTSPGRDVDRTNERVVRRPEHVRDGLFVDGQLERELQTVLERFEPDVIHAHNLTGFPLGIDRLLAAYPAPLIQTIHDWSTFCPNAWCVHGDGGTCAGGAGAKCFQNDCATNQRFDANVAWMTRMRELILAQGVDVALVPSQALTAMASSHGFADVRHLPYSIDTSNLDDAVSEQRATDRLLFLGRVQPEKGTMHLIDAMPKILRERPNARLTFVGSGMQLGDVKARAEELGVAGQVDFHKKVPYEQVKRFYAEATVLILPSVWSENSPLTCYESLFVGLPMIGSRIGGIPELVVEGETGLLVAPRDAADIARGVVQFCSLSTEERAVFSRKGRALSATLTRERNVSGVLRAYDDALAAGSAAKLDSSMTIDEDWAALAVAFTSAVRCSTDHCERLEKSVMQAVTARGLKALATPAGFLYGARRQARKLGLPKFFRRS